MADRSLFRKINFPLAHLPTFFFIIGYPVFWLELYVFKAKEGVTSSLAWILFILVTAIAFWRWLKEPKKEGTFYRNAFLSSTNSIQRLFLFMGFLLGGIILTIVVLAALQPIHLMQESDCLQYHYTLPRQHLILGSFAHIPWAADDLFLLPVDFSLAPFWFATVLPNKLPQLIILFGLMGVLVRLACSLVRVLGPSQPWAPVLVLFAFLGSHGLGIQMGTGMLDLTAAYLFFAAWDSLQKGQWSLAAIEFTFFFWSKPFIPLQVIVVAALLVIIIFMARFLKYELTPQLHFLHWRRAFTLFLVLSLFVGGPFIVKSIVYAATPLFPFSPGMLGSWSKIQAYPQAWESLQQACHSFMTAAIKSYGHGRDLGAFLKHVWFLAVPEKGVNNAFDYPLGLPYLLFIVPFIFFFVRDLFKRQVCLLSVLVILLWGSWWFGSQQARFLYIPVILIFLITIVRFNPNGFDKMSTTLLGCLVVALALHAVSVWGAHKADIGRPALTVLRDSDKKLLELNRTYLQNPSGYIEWLEHDVAYAQFPVKVTREKLPHTIFSE